MQVTTLEDGFAARITGVDLSQPLADDLFAEIRSLWMEHRVVHFPDQQLNDDSLVGFAERFGRLFVHAQTSLLSKKPTARLVAPPPLSHHQSLACFSHMVTAVPLESPFLSAPPSLPFCRGSGGTIWSLVVLQRFALTVPKALLIYL